MFVHRYWHIEAEIVKWIVLLSLATSLVLVFASKVSGII